MMVAFQIIILSLCAVTFIVAMGIGLAASRRKQIEINDREDRNRMDDGDFKVAFEFVASAVAEDLGVQANKLLPEDEIEYLGYGYDNLSAEDGRDDLFDILSEATSVPAKQFAGCKTLGDIAKRLLVEQASVR